MSTSTTLRWGIASTGKIAAKMTEALAELPAAQVVAVGSRTLAAAEAFADRFAIPKAHGSHAELVADGDVDIVYVASPHAHHRQMTIDALDAGKHVLCEKAFAVNAAQARDMVAAAERNDRFLMEAMWSWFIPALVEVRERVRRGEIGRVRVVEANFGIPVLDPDGRHRRPELTGGALLDLGIYPLAIARFLLGEPDAVRALGHLTADGVDALAGGVLRFADDAIAVFHTTIDFQSDCTATVTGTEGRIDIEAPFWFASAFTVTRNGDDAPERVEIPNSGLAHEAAHAMERIQAGHRESDVMPWATTIANMELMDEIRHQLGVVYPEER